MRVTFDNVDASVVFHDVGEEAWLDHFLSYPERIFARGKHRGDRRIPLYRPDRGTFPAGLVPLVRAGCAKAEYTCDVVDGRVRHVPEATADLGWLKPHQRAAVDAMLRATRGMVWHTTAAGKTELFVAATRVLPVSRHCIVVDAVGLLDQTASRFEARGDPRPGVIGDGVWNADERVTVASIDTLAAGLKREEPRVLRFLQSVGVVHVDEAHGAASASHTAVLRAMTSAVYRWGYSGTPWGRTDSKSMVIIGNLGPTCHRVAAKDIPDMLAMPRVRFLPCAHADQRRAEWRTQYDRAVVDNDARNAALLDAVSVATKPVLVLVTSVEHGRKLTAALGARGVVAEFVYGEDETHFRTACARRIAHGDTDVVVATTVFRTGIDIPELRCVVNAAGGKSAIAVVQGTGRGMRRMDAHGREIKSVVDVVDVADVGGPGWLSRHTRARRRAYEAAGYQVVGE